MTEGNASASRLHQLAYDSIMAADSAATSSTQPNQPAGAPAVLGPYSRALAGSPATRIGGQLTTIVGQPTTDSNSQRISRELQYPSLSAVGAQPFSAKLGGMADASQQTIAAGSVAHPISVGGRPPTASILDSTSYLVHLPKSPPHGGDDDMQVAVLGAADRSMVSATPPQVKARWSLKRPDPPPQRKSPPGPFMVNREGEIAMFRQQLLESHERAGNLTRYVANAMGMLQDREAWWRKAAAGSFSERTVLLEEAQAQEQIILDRINQMGSALQHLSTDATLSESQRAEQVSIIANLKVYASSLHSAGA